jgi:hypothetical protein
MNARLTPHARERAAQMGISTKCIKGMLQRGEYTRFADIKYCGGRWHARGAEFTAVVIPEGDDLLVLTVLYNQPFVRPEVTQ